MSDDPPTLPVGTEVSAKFKGAYCEARIARIVTESVKIRVFIRGSAKNVSILTKNELVAYGTIAAGQRATMRVGNKIVDCLINNVKDCSIYHVVFNDGDKKDLRRTHMVLKGKRHFSNETNLDSMPLTNPEQFSTPVRAAAQKGAQKIKESSSARRYTIRETVEREPVADDDEEEDEDEDQRDMEQATTSSSTSDNRQRRKEDESETEESDNEEPVRRKREHRIQRVAGMLIDDDDPEGPRQREPGGRRGVDRDFMDEIEPGQPENGSPESAASAMSKKQQKELDKQARKREKEKLKEEAKLEKDRQRELDRERKNKERQEQSARRRREKLFHGAVELSNDRHERFTTQAIVHPSQHYILRKVRRKLQKKGRRRHRHERYRLRNFRLYARWRDLTSRIGLSFSARFRKQWMRMTDVEFMSKIRNYKLMRSKLRAKIVRLWMRRQEKSRRVKFVVYHDEPKLATKLLKYVEKEEERPVSFIICFLIYFRCFFQLTFAERMQVPHEDLQTSTFRSHFLNQTWYPAVLFPGVKTDPRGSQCLQRDIRHMGNGKVMTVWEDHLIPFDWLPVFDDKEMKKIVEQRPPEMRSQFTLAMKFALNYTLEQINRPHLNLMLEWTRRKQYHLPRRYLPPELPTAPSPSKRNEQADDNPLHDDSDEDYDSDSSIKNATTEDKDRFIAMLMQAHDSDYTILDTTPTIQGHDVDLHYLYCLALRLGGPKKVYASNPWAEWAKKLVPQAVNAEDELKEIFKTCLENYLTISTKLSWPMENLAARNERKVVLPGQYSENRKKRALALQNLQGQQNSNQPTPGTGRGRGGARGGARKRKEASHDGSSDKKRVKQSISRGTTASPRISEDRSQQPGPSNAVYDDYDDDDSFEITIDRESAKKKKSKTLGRRSEREGSTSAGPPKKGRPRKHPLPGSSNSSATPKAAERERRGSNRESFPEYARANIISDIKLNDRICASYHEQWFKSQVSITYEDISVELLDIMLQLQENIDSNYHRQLYFESIERLWETMKVTAHYIGWNSRYDESMPLTKIMVTNEAQQEARRRFLDLPNGDKLHPDTLSIVEEAYCQESDLMLRPNYKKLAREALRPSVPQQVSAPRVDDDDMDIDDDSMRRRQRNLVDQDERSDDFDFDPVPTQNGRRGDSEETEGNKKDSDDEDNVSVDDMKMEVEEERGIHEESPELGLKSSSGSPGVSKAVSRESSPVTSESREQSVESSKSSESSRSSKSSESRKVSKSRDSVETSASEELGEKSVQRSLSPEAEKVVADSQPDDAPTSSPDSSPGAESVTPEPTPRDVGQKDLTLEEKGVRTETEVFSSSTKSIEETPKIEKDLESDSDEPEYPDDPLSSSHAEDGSDLHESNSAEGPLSTIEDSNYTPQKTMPSCPSVNVERSGPLTLDEVPVPSASTSSGPLEKEEIATESDDQRKRSNTVSSVDQPLKKRPRRASERSGGIDEGLRMRSPEQRHSNPLVHQMSSGVLTLEMTHRPESSGPIEPQSIRKSAGAGRRRTASPNLNTSGPLTLHSPQPSTSIILTQNVVSITPKGRPPGASPQLGRPKKLVTPVVTVPSTSSKSAELKEEKTEEIPEASTETTAIAVEPTVVAEIRKEDDVSEHSTSPEDEDDKQETESSSEQNDMNITPKGTTIRGGKRKRGGRFGGSYTTRPVKSASVSARKNQNQDTSQSVDDIEEKETDEPEPSGASIPSTPSYSSRDGWTQQKQRMAEEMRKDGSDRNFDELDLANFDLIIAGAPAEDINMYLEERTNELRELYANTKYEYLTLEKRFRKTHEAKKKAETEASKSPSVIDEPSTSASPSTSKN
ncbi:hypothetical protein CRE_18488 [Caenorhabditis remanei]|uniref:ARID domain-containing protein n=1 Tax=Caenorhabditis remanei TaxID=31234 RepID=E3LKU4_CAERE|nr:hypothetical protein CRE_18488 [Caenorhabditis remanei]